MAVFQTHLIGGVVTGAGVGSVGMFSDSLDIIQVIAVFFMGTLGGLLPDLDSDTGKPLSLLFQLVSVLIPALLLDKAVQVGGSSVEFIISYFLVSYILLKYVICIIVKKITVHRGMMHSLPFALLCGGFAFLLFETSGKDVSLFAGISVSSGCFVHLLLDEMHSIKLKFGFIPVLKTSAGSALKLKSGSWPPTVLHYLMLAGVLLMIVL